MYPSAGDNPETFAKTEEPTPTDARPDPAYAAALSEQSLMIETRARAVDLVIKAFGAPPPDAPEAMEKLFDVSNRFYAYLVSGK